MITFSSHQYSYPSSRNIKPQDTARPQFSGRGIKYTLAGLGSALALASIGACGTSETRAVPVDGKLIPYDYENNTNIPDSRLGPLCEKMVKDYLKENQLTEIPKDVRIVCGVEKNSRSAGGYVSLRSRDDDAERFVPVKGKLMPYRLENNTTVVDAEIGPECDKLMKNYYLEQLKNNQNKDIEPFCSVSSNSIQTGVRVKKS